MTQAAAAVATTETDPLAGQPIVRVVREGVEYTLLGTAHVSRASVEAVQYLLGSESFDAVAIELCDSRWQAVQNPDAWQQMDLFKIIREGKAGLVAANLALSSYQRRLAEQFGIEPGAEMRAAAQLAAQQGKPVWLIDRDVGATLKRAYSAVGFWDKLGIFGGVMASLVVSDEVSEQDIEKLKQGDLLESTFSEFAKQSEPLYRTLIAERDEYMACRLREESAAQPQKRVLAVVGAGHLQGLERQLRENTEPAPSRCADLAALPPPSIWPKIIGWAVLLFIVAGFSLAFARGAEIGGQAILYWILATGILGAIGATLAGAHPLSVLSAFIASPLTPLHPALASGTVSAAVEIFVRRPRVADFGALRDDLQRWTGWWKNRVARTLLVFFLTSFGTSIGVYLAGYQIFSRLL